MMLVFSRSSSSDFSTALALFRLSASRSTSYSSDSSLNCTCSSSSFGITCAAYNFSARPRSARKTLVSAWPVFQICLNRPDLGGSRLDVGGNLAVIQFCQNLPLMRQGARLGQDRHHQTLPQCGNVHLVFHHHRTRGDENALLGDARWLGPSFLMHRSGGNHGCLS